MKPFEAEIAEGHAGTIITTATLARRHIPIEAERAVWVIGDWRIGAPRGTHARPCLSITNPQGDVADVPVCDMERLIHELWSWRIR